MAILSPTNFSRILPLKESYLNLCETGSRLLELRIAEVVIRSIYLHPHCTAVLGVVVVLVVSQIPTAWVLPTVVLGVLGGAMMSGSLIACLEWVGGEDLYWVMGLKIAVWAGHVKMVEELFQHLPQERLAQNLKRDFAKELFFKAIGSGHEEIAQRIFDAAKLDPNVVVGNETPLLWKAAIKESKPALEFLLKRLNPGVSPNLPHWSNPEGNCLLVAALYRKSLDIAKLILEQMSPEEIVNHRHPHYGSLLHVAAQLTDEDNISLLLAYWPEGADLNPVHPGFFNNNRIPLDHIVTKNHVLAARRIFQRMGREAAQDLISAHPGWLEEATDLENIHMVHALQHYGGMKTPKIPRGG